MSRINFDDDENPEREYPTFQADDTHTYQDDFALRAMRHKARLQPAGISPVYPLHLRNHPQWSGNNELGFEIGFEPDANNRQMLLKLGEWDAPEVWTLMLGVKYDIGEETTHGQFGVTAELLVGCGGATQELQLDMVQGSAIALPMNALNVTAVFDQRTLGDPPTSLRLVGTLVRGAVAHARPTRSFHDGFPGDADPTASNFIKIPAFARRLFVLWSGGADSLYLSSTLVVFRASQVTGQATFVRGNQILTFSEGIPIPPSARYVIIANGTVPTPFDFVLIFELGL